jgi:hypothetical protein
MSHHHRKGVQCSCQNTLKGESLYPYIDIDNIRCLNERSEWPAKYIFKPDEASHDYSKVSEISDENDKTLSLTMVFSFIVSGKRY